MNQSLAERKIIGSDTSTIKLPLILVHRESGPLIFFPTLFFIQYIYNQEKGELNFPEYASSFTELCKLVVLDLSMSLSIIYTLLYSLPLYLPHFAELKSQQMYQLKNIIGNHVYNSTEHINVFEV